MASGLVLTTSDVPGAYIRSGSPPRAEPAILVKTALTACSYSAGTKTSVDFGW